MLRKLNLPEQTQETIQCKSLTRNQKAGCFSLALLTILLIINGISAYADSLEMIMTGSDGSFEAVSCGSSAGNFRVVYSASTGTYTFFYALPGDCPLNSHYLVQLVVDSRLS